MFRSSTAEVATVLDMAWSLKPDCKLLVRLLGPVPSHDRFLLRSFKIFQSILLKSVACCHVALMFSLPPSLPPSLPLHRYTLMLPSFWGICLPMLSTCPCLQVIGLTSLLPPCWQCLPWNDHLECVRLGLLCSMQSQSHAVAFWQSGKEEHP